MTYLYDIHYLTLLAIIDPLAVAVPAKNVACALKYTVVVDATLTLKGGVAMAAAPITAVPSIYADIRAAFGNVAEVSEVQSYSIVKPFVPVIKTFPETSQSPAVSEIDVTFAAVAVVKLTADACRTVLLITSPTLPAAALSLVVVPIIPEVELNVKLVADAAPKVGVTKVGEVERTVLPVPVEVTTPVPPLLTGRGIGKELVKDWLNLNLL